MRYRIIKCSLVLSIILLGCSRPKTEAVSPNAAPSVTPAEEEETPTEEPAGESGGELDFAKHIERVVAEQDRSPEDRALDEQRNPVMMLQFFGIRPGMRVAELAVGGGYTAELLARTVGPAGKVYGQNTPFILQRFAKKPWGERLNKPVMGNVVPIESELDTPLPQDATNLDAVLMVLFYHDTVWFKTDRPKMNAAIYAALKPGGVYGIVDHNAREGDGVSQAETLHRIEKSVLVGEVLAAGFVLDAEATFLKNDDDPRDWNASPSQAGDKRGTSDRFVLRFVKPMETSDDSAPTKETQDAVSCSEPRRKACTKELHPVCGNKDTGIRCIKAPCPSSEQHTYNNPCLACADDKVLSYVEGACTEQKPNKE